MQSGQRNHPRPTHRGWFRHPPVEVGSSAVFFRFTTTSTRATSMTQPPRPAQPATLRVLVLCTRNSARSQMAEALFASIGGARVIAASAGSDPGPGVHPLAVEALAEIGIDWRGRPAQGIDAVSGVPWDAVITVCDAARDACPYMPTAGLTAHWGVEDPAAAAGDQAARLQAFRATRDLLGDAILAFFAAVDRSLASAGGLHLRDALDAGQRIVDPSVNMSPDDAAT